MHCTVRTCACDPFPIPVMKSIQSMDSLIDHGQYKLMELLLELYGDTCTCMEMYGDVCAYMYMYGDVWRCMEMYVHICTCMEMYVHVWRYIAVLC